MRNTKSKTVVASSICIAVLWGLMLSFSSQSKAALANDFSHLGDVGQNERLVSQFVWQTMERNHLSRHGVDDEISQRAFDKYIKLLDPARAYFRQSDMDEFSQWKTQLDDQMKASDYSAAFQIFNRFVQRVDEQTQMALELLGEDHDFTVDEELTVDTDLARYATGASEARDLWRKRIKYELLMLRGQETKTGDAAVDPREILRKKFRSIHRRIHQMDSENVIEQYISSITSSFDPHTSYMSNRSFDNFMIQMNLELDGIGASLQGSDDGYTVIKRLVAGGAASNQGGLKLEDRIVAVAQGNDRGQDADPNLARKYGTDFVEAAGMRVDDVVDMIRGQAGTVVRLSVLSEGETGLHTVSLVREKIQLDDQAARGAIFEGAPQPDGSPNRIGVLELPMFYAGMKPDGAGGRSTTADVRRILHDFNRNNVDALVLDLRRNGGGSLKEAVDCTGLFIDAGPIVQIKNAYGQIDVLNDTQRGVAWTKPMIVLTSKFSASASEILAGAIQDYRRGLIVGDSATHGKGTVQNLLNISQMVYNQPNAPDDFGALKITTQQFYRPNGDSTQLRGVLADIRLPSVTDKMDVSESDLDYPVEFDRIRPARYGTYAMTGWRLIQRLEERSEQRLNNSVDFQKQLADILKYIENKKTKTISLNEEKFMARRQQLTADEDEETTLAAPFSPNEIERDFYLDEVLQITSDYANLLSDPGRSTSITATERS